jgi:hypothetical protein
MRIYGPCYVSCAMPWPTRSTQRVWSYRGLSCLVPLQAVAGMALALLLLAVSDQRGAAVLGIANLCVGERAFPHLMRPF